ncbi:MAG: Stk1 family PASTA domain-containing Ser/Thr kinase, partial [Cellulomonas sp.]|nr:Stk1 family PASTA domain-containing Ser/Thr kinase [Cellulomonas sp.]
MVDEGSRILAGRYEVGELIGRGGMAEVHIGYDRRLGRTVAIKILRSDLARDPSFQNRFRREAQSAAALNHPAIVAVYDTGEDVITEPTGVAAHVPFIVMEYVEGHTVRDILRDGAAVPIEEAVEITAGVLSALEYSHHAGIVHRDIKPANVMLTPTGAVKVMDFGIARAVADSAATMTQTQAVIGTAQYLSPEQARGEQVDTRSDLYSTGCLLFELLTGRPPFTGDSPVAVAYQHVRENPPAPSDIASDVPDTLDRITLKALAKERDDRYQTAGEFRADLEAVLRGGAVGAPPVGAFAVAGAAGALAAGEATQVMAPATAATQAFTPGSAAWGATG